MTSRDAVQETSQDSKEKILDPVVQDDHPKFNPRIMKTLSRMETIKNRKKIAMFLGSRCVEYFIIGLIIIYSLLVFINIGIDSAASDDNNLDDVLYGLIIVELVILSIFAIEILLNIFAYGFKFYFRDRWMLFDALVIIGSIILVVLDLNISDTQFSSISKILRAIFRFLRIFLLFRKVNHIKKIKVAYSRYDLKSPVEKILEILGGLKEMMSVNKSLVKEIEWCIEVISSNRLYDPIIETLGKEKQTEVANWLLAFSHQENKKKTLTEIKNDNSPTKNGAIEESKTSNSVARTKRNSLLMPIPGTEKNDYIPPEVRDLLKNVHEIDFDCFKFKEVGDNYSISYLMNFIFKEHDLFDKLNINTAKFNAFTRRIQTGYLDNPYHNAIHSIDVTQTVEFFMMKCQLQELAEFTFIETAAMYIAACIHDFEHPGTNNPFQISSRSIYSIRYNDKAVLEMHHVSAAFVITQEENCAIFENFSREDYIKIRERLVSLVLATDMSMHFSELSKLKGRLATSDFNIKEKDKYPCMEMTIHAADISNPLKPTDICIKWTEKVLEEFWNQGDTERKNSYPISYLCDRYTTNTSKSQIGFIDVIVLPTFEVMKTFMPVLHDYISNLTNNKNMWKEKVEFFDEKLKELNDTRQKEQPEQE